MRRFPIAEIEQEAVAFRLESAILRLELASLRDDIAHTMHDLDRYTAETADDKY